MAWIPAFAGMTVGEMASAINPTNVMPAQAGIHARVQGTDSGRVNAALPDEMN